MKTKMYNHTWTDKLNFKDRVINTTNMAAILFLCHPDFRPNLKDKTNTSTVVQMLKVNLFLDSTLGVISIAISPTLGCTDD